MSLSLLKKAKYLVPNFITLASLTLGMASIYNAVHGRLELACYLILWSSILDKTDGIAARALNASSLIGLHLDSFADFVSFGIAPSFLLRSIMTLHKQKSSVPYCLMAPNSSTFPSSSIFSLFIGPCTQHMFTLIFALIYVYGAAIRLSRFNVAEQCENEEISIKKALAEARGETWTPPKQTHVIMTGVASTLAGFTVAILTLTALKYQHHPIFSELLLPLPFSCILALFGILMNSPFRYLKPGSGKLWQKILTMSAIASIVPLIILRIYPEWGTFLSVTAVFISPLFTISKSQQDHENDSKKQQ